MTFFQKDLDFDISSSPLNDFCPSQNVFVPRPPKCLEKIYRMSKKRKALQRFSELYENGGVSSHQILKGRTDRAETAHETMNQPTRKGTGYYAYRY